LDPVLLSTLVLEREVESEVEAMTDRIFAGIEQELQARVREGSLECRPPGDDVSFDYDTRLLLPAILTHGRLHLMAGDLPLRRRLRTVDEALLTAGQATTAEIVGALLDGDMRDAINDDEYADFETNVRPKPEAARVAQRHLQAAVEDWFAQPDTPAAVETHYSHAVELSEAHQHADTAFRDLLAAHAEAADGDRETAAERIRDEYKYAPQRSPSELFEAERDLPYFTTQYERVGIIYEDMLRMYEAALDVDLGQGYKRSIVLMVIAAQVGLDDTDDYPADRDEQLTPVTAELTLHDARDGIANLRQIVETYLDRAERYAEDHLTALAIEYIRQQSADRLARLERTVTADPTA
jgi:hypothetical protein